MEQCGLRLVVRARALKSRVAAHSHIVVIRETFITRSAFDTLFFFFFVFRDENDRFIEIIRLKNRASRSTVQLDLRNRNGGDRARGWKEGRFLIRSFECRVIFWSMVQVSRVGCGCRFCRIPSLASKLLACIYRFGVNFFLLINQIIRSLFSSTLNFESTSSRENIFKCIF